MKCEEVKELFDSFLSQKSSEENLLNIENHLISCSGCSHYYEENRKLSKFMDSWEYIEPRDHFVGEFWKRIEVEEVERKSGFWEYFKGFKKAFLVPSLAVAIFCSLLVINMYNTNNDGSLSEKDIKDERFLSEIEELVSIDSVEMLKVYGLWSDIEEQRAEG